MNDQSQHLIRAVTGPLDSRLVRQMVPSPGRRKQGSRGPRRRGARVCPKLAAPGNVTVRALFTQQLFDSRSHSQFYGPTD